MYRLQSPHGSGHDSDGYGINSAYMTGTDDGAVPVAHHDIVAIFETVRARAVSDSFFALFKLLEQAKVSRDWERGRQPRSQQSTADRAHPWP